MSVLPGVADLQTWQARQKLQPVASDPLLALAAEDDTCDGLPLYCYGCGGMRGWGHVDPCPVVAVVEALFLLEVWS